MKPRKDNTSQVDDVLQNLLKSIDPYKNIQQYKSFLVWDECVGENIANHAQPEDIKKGVLYVNVSNSSWLQQLNFMKEDIKKKLNKKIGRAVVKDIRLQTGEVVRKPQKQNPPSASELPPLPPDLELEIDAHVKNISDPVLREKLRLLFTSSARRNT